MKTNLVQNYIKNVPYGVINQPSDKPYYDIQRIIDTKTFIQPLPGKGKLVKSSITDAPSIMIKDAVYDTKALKHAINGDANDHELGRLNDLGMKLGGLAIAGYLFTKRQTPMTKIMEFIGLGSFFASMAIWPKIAIQLPAYLVHGVNVQQKYEDSFGRRKPFYQDPQFIPWDLYSDEEIQKIGDRLKVPKNMPNRRDYIQEKMRKIAVQNNTLWMLTAGFATPIMSALICNVSEPYIVKLINNFRNRKADNIIKDFNAYNKKHKETYTAKNLEKLYREHQDGVLDKKLRQEIIDIFTDTLDPISAKHFKSDFNAIYPDNKYLIDRNTSDLIIENLQNTFKDKNFDNQLLESMFGTEKSLTEFLSKNNRLNKTVEYNDFNDITRELMKYIRTNYDKFYEAHPNLIKEDWEEIADIILSNDNKSHPLYKALRKVSANTFDGRMFEELKEIAVSTDIFRTGSRSLDKYIGLKVAAAPETVIANYWNETQKELLKAFNFSFEEIKKANLDENIMGEILRDKIETVVSDEKAYKRLLNKIIDKVASLEKDINDKDIVSHILNKHDGKDFYSEQKLRTSFERLTDKVFDQYAEALKEKGFTSTSKAIAGVNVSDSTGTSKNIMKAFAQERLLGVKSAFYRLINTLDFYRKVATEANEIPGIAGKCRTIKEELLELCKITLLEGHASDHMTKFYQHRNIAPDLTDMSDVVVVKGKVKNAEYGTVIGKADIPNDYKYYKSAMEAMFGGEMHSDTYEILNRSPLKHEMKNYRELVYKKIGGWQYFVKYRSITGNEAVSTGSDIIFNLTGVSPKEMLFKQGQQLYNTKKWLRIFGIAGAVLLAVTVGAQFFFGKLKNTEGKK